MGRYDNKVRQSSGETGMMEAKAACECFLALCGNSCTFNCSSTSTKNISPPRISGSQK